MDYQMTAAAGSTNWHGHEGIGDGETVFQIEGAWTGNIFFEGRTAGGATFAVMATPVHAGTAAVSSLAAGETGAWRVDSGGIQVRARKDAGTGTPMIRVQDAGH
jgi:hypothetical protein